MITRKISMCLGGCYFLAKPRDQLVQSDFVLNESLQACQNVCVCVCVATGQSERVNASKQYVQSRVISEVNTKSSYYGTG